MKLTVFTYSEVCLINYFQLEVPVFWDCLLAVILLFEQILDFAGHTQNPKAQQEVTSVLTICDILKKKITIRQQQCLFMACIEKQ